MNPMRLIALLIAACVALVAVPLAADPADIQAASRSVVRVVLVAEEDGETFYVGHGSGFAVAPDKIITNAHLVAPLREDASIRIGIIPSEGTTTYGGRLVAISARNDLAMIQLERGRLPSLALLQTPLDDGASVMAIGYPAAVDARRGSTHARRSRPWPRSRRLASSRVEERRAISTRSCTPPRSPRAIAAARWSIRAAASSG